MQDLQNVTTEAFRGYIEDVADELAVSGKRVYQMLDQNNYYEKLWRLLNPLGRVAPERLELIRADFNARVDRVIGGRTAPSTPATLHKEVSEAVNAVLEKAPSAERRQQIIEAIAELQKQLKAIDRSVDASSATLARFGR